MSTVAEHVRNPETPVPSIAPSLSEGQRVVLDHWLTERFDRLFEERMSARAQQASSLCIIVTKGTLDWAYPPFILASTAAAMGWDTTIFFSFYGVGLLKKELQLQLSPLASPGAPFKLPYGPGWLRGRELAVPNLAMAGIPGFGRLATAAMEKTIREKGIAPVRDLRDICVESGTRLIGCRMSLDLFGWDIDEFIPEVTEWAGAATYLTIAEGADINLFM